MKQQNLFLFALCLITMLALGTSKTQAQSSRLAIEKPNNGVAGVVLQNPDNGSMIFKLGNNERMWLTNSGNLGIGTTSPARKLHIKSDTWNTQFVLERGFGHNAGFGIAADSDWIHFLKVTGVGSNTESSTPLMVFRQSNGQVGIGTLSPGAKLHVNGDAIKTDGETWTVASDRILKHEIENFSDGLQTILAIQPKTYRYNGKAGFSDNGKKHVGIIAQDIQPIAPYMVSEFYRKLEETDAQETRLLKYNSSALPYILINAIKELNGTNTTLKTEVDNLKTENTALKTKLTDLETRLKKLEEALNKNND